MSEDNFGTRLAKRWLKTLFFPKSTSVETNAMDLDADFFEKVITAAYRELISKILGETVRVEASRCGMELILDARSEALRELFRESEKLPDALEHILRKLPSGRTEPLPFHVRVDAMGVRQKRREGLKTMAVEVADRVFSTQKPIVLTYRHASERKIIHEALAGDDRVYAKSIGQSSVRKIMVVPVRRKAGLLESDI